MSDEKTVLVLNAERPWRLTVEKFAEAARSMRAFSTAAQAIVVPPGMRVTVQSYLSPEDFDAWAGPAVAVRANLDAVRRENAEARERWRERMLQGLYGINGSTGERACASCGGGGFWYVCMACSTGAPSKRNSTWRISPWAAARIREKAKARRYDEPLPLP